MSNKICFLIIDSSKTLTLLVMTNSSKELTNSLKKLSCYSKIVLNGPINKKSNMFQRKKFNIFFKSDEFLNFFNGFTLKSDY